MLILFFAHARLS